MAKSELKLAEIAERIHAHLKRFEADPKINKLSKRPMRLHIFYEPSAIASGSRIGIRLKRYHDYSFITKQSALEYLAWLDAGHVGGFWEMRAKQEARRR